MSLAATTFYLPYKMCPDRECDRHKKGLRLSKAQQLRAVYFSSHDGAVPAYSISMQCEGKYQTSVPHDADVTLNMNKDAQRHTITITRLWGRIEYITTSLMGFQMSSR